MNDRSYLAILAGGALFMAGMAGCDAGDQRDPGSPDPDSTAMYGADETDQTQTDALEERQMQAEERTQQQPAQTRQPTEDRSYATGARQEGSVAGLESMSEQEIVGMTVVSREGEEIGEIDEIAMEGSGAMGQDKLAVVDVGGFLGIGEKSVAIPFDDLELAQDGRIQTDLTREALQSQPEYEGDDMGEETGEQIQ